MPIKGYGVLKGKVIDMLNGLGSKPHFQVKVCDDDIFRIAINVKSQEKPSTVLFYADNDFKHPILKDLVNLPSGFKELKSRPGGMALDFIRGNLFDATKMNQGNSENWKSDDGVWQDGGIIFHYPDEKRWVAVFIAFQSQFFHTDDITGNAINEVVDKRVLITAALVNPIDVKEKNVTILNST